MEGEGGEMLSFRHFAGRSLCFLSDDDPYRIRRTSLSLFHGKGVYYCTFICFIAIYVFSCSAVRRCLCKRTPGVGKQIAFVCGAEAGSG